MKHKPRITLATYPWAYFVPGGGEVQIQKLYQYLNRQKVQVKLFDQWAPAESDLYHFFSCIGGSLDFLRFLKNNNERVIQSSSLWLTDENIVNYDISYITEQFKYADFVVANSELEASMLERYGLIESSKTKVVHNGFDDMLMTIRKNPIISKKLYRPLHDLPSQYMVFVGNIEPRKNLDICIQVCRRLRIPLVILGKVRDREYANKYLFPFINNGSVYYAGYYQNNSFKFLSVVMNAVGLLLPSSLETPGLAALEAAALGVPLLVTSCGSAKEYFGNKCLYYNGDRKDVDELEQAVSQLGSTPEKYIVDIETITKYTWSNVSEDQVNVYHECIS